MSTPPDVEFFWDPVCPWAWLTSRWVNEVARQRGLEVEWRFISLRLLNEGADYERDFPEGYTAIHGAGLKLLRVAAAIRQAEGPERMGELYTRFGGDIHVRRRRKELTDHWEAGFPDYLRSVGIEEKYLDAANDDAYDGSLRAERDEALSRTGPDVGTPIVSFNRDGATYGFFGPVISRVPEPAEAVALWDAISYIATFDCFAELKRNIREEPQLATSLDLEGGA